MFKINIYVSSQRKKASKLSLLKNILKNLVAIFSQPETVKQQRRNQALVLGSNKTVTNNIIYKINFSRTLDSIIQLKLSCAILFINHFCL